MSFGMEELGPQASSTFPAKRRQNTVLAEMDLSLGTRHLLTFGYRRNHLRYQDVFPSPLRSTELLNRTEHTYSLRLTRRLSSKTSAVIEGSYELMDFDEAASLRDGQAYRAEAGFVFNPKSNVRGQALLGYKHMVPKLVLQPEYSGLIGSVDVLTQMGERFDVRTLYSRDTLPSVVAGNWYFIEHRFGSEVDVLGHSLLIFLARRGLRSKQLSAASRDHQQRRRAGRANHRGSVRYLLSGH